VLTFTRFQALISAMTATSAASRRVRRPRPHGRERQLRSQGELVPVPAEEQPPARGLRPFLQVGQPVAGGVPG
jgi:hypothetical protein